jgi:WXG100 family type VII secretion target
MTVRYNYGGIADAQSVIDKFIKDMDAELDAIEGGLKPLEGEAWSGSQAQESYYSLKEQWRAAAGEIAQSLVNLKGALGQGSEGIQSADLRSAQYFGG